MRPGGPKLLLLMTGAITAVVILVTVVIGVVAYHRSEAVVLAQACRNNLQVIERLKTCALLSAAPAGEEHEHGMSPIQHVSHHLADVEAEGNGYIQVIDAAWNPLADSRPTAFRSPPPVPGTVVRQSESSRLVTLRQLRGSVRGVAGTAFPAGAPPEVLAVSYVPGLDWFILYHQPLSQVLTRVHTVTNPILVVLSLVMLTVPLQAFLFMKTVIRPYAMQPLEKAVKAERAEADALLDAVADGIIVIGRDYRVKRINRVMEERYGNTIGRSCYETYFCETVPCAVCPCGQVFETGRPARVVREAVLPEGRRCLESIATPLRNEEGELTAAIEVIRDITERRQAEEVLARSARMRALGELATGIAHEIRTPVNGILVFLEEVQAAAQRIGAPEEMRGDLDMVRAQTERVVRITDRILGFAKQESPQVGALDVNSIVGRALDFTGSSLEAAAVQLVDARSDEPQWVVGNGDELEEVVLNLIVNAQEAMPHGGRLELGTGREDDCVLIGVSDTGVGIPPENLAKVFEPGFSTKADQGVAKGLGLGLFLSQGIVEALGGRITVESQAGVGTAFTVRLPAAPAAGV